MKKKQTTQWTKAQSRAIETIGRDVLVTASAGTGKTAVLSQRVVERIGDANDPAQADNVLVLTFTDAAAEEMRSRIAETLRKRFIAQRDGQLRRQLLLLDRAYISTIHSFCKRILTEFFYLIDLNPTFGILDADEQRLLKTELLDKTLQEAWEDEPLAKGLEILFEGRRIQPGRGSFVDRIIPLSEFLDSVVSRELFYERAAALNDAHTQTYSQLRDSQKQILLEKLANGRSRLEYVLQLDAQLCGGQYAAAHIHDEIMPVILSCTEFLKRDRFDACAELLADLTFGQLRKKKDVELSPEEQARIKNPIDKVKKELKTLCDFALLNNDYEAVLAAQVHLQTKVLLELLRRFDLNYAAAKQSRNVLDFADLEHAMLKLLQSHPAVAQKLRERFEYIFVDEYQDINDVQQRILDHLRRSNNVFVVGDIKQSIYSFRQSKPRIFLTALQNAADITEKRGQELLISPTEKRGQELLISPNCHSRAGASPAMAGDIAKQPGRVDLQENFRCRQEIINFVNALFGKVMTKAVADMDYDQRAALKSGYPYPPFTAAGGPNHPVELYLLDEDAAEEEPQEDEPEHSTESISAVQRQAAFIARRIQQIVGAESGKPQFQIYDKTSDAFRDVQYRDIVILMRSLSHKAQDYVEMLRLAGVPVSSQSACGYFEATEISDCLCLLKVLDNADRDIELASLLRSPIFGLTDSQLATIRLNADRHTNFYQAVLTYAKNGSDTSLRETLYDILSQLNQWRSQVRQGSLADLLDTIFRTKRLLSFYSALPNGAQRRANLLKLHDHAIQFEHFRTTDPGAALGRFVEFLEKLDELEQDWAPAEPDSSAENAVRLMSVHKSKGLEFPVVFVAELNTPFNMRSSIGQCLIDEQTVGLQIIDRKAQGRFASLAHQVIAERQKKTDRAEEMRILYVALTRAREKLILTAGRKETACVNLLAECAGFDKSLPDWKLTEARSHLDWLLMGMACSEQKRGQELFISSSDSLFHAARISQKELDEITDQIRRKKRSLKSYTTPPPAGTEAAKQAQGAFEAIRQNLLWRYPFEDVTRLSAKLSVSEFTHADDEFAKVDAARAFSKKPAVTDKPVKSSSGADALSLGSAVHRVLEHLDLSKPVNAASLQQTIAALVKDALLNEPLAKQINAAAILTFFDSDLGQLAQQAGRNVLREWPFTYALNVADTGGIVNGTQASCLRCFKRGLQAHVPLGGVASGNDEIIVLQGIVDMIIPTEKGLVIVDFKTDRIREDEISQRVEHYAEQLAAYARAAGDILKQPIAAAWLYFLTPQKAVEVFL